ncbi:MAG: hypothetical protein SAJ37_04255 [Oscillatoria sp. PMC 1068.18]|nr:hypothetical protein [Oscillatoria sp. PMC 1076.18]MEC4987940.1 hypothetical protein [Oscillatoria sp. PMC 1068.18]
MSLPQNCVFVNDIKLGKTAKKLLSYNLVSNCRTNVEICFASQVNLSIPRRWEVKPEVALPLVAKLWLITNQLAAEKTLYLDGNLFIRGNIEEIFQQQSQTCLQATEEKVFGYLDFFVVNYSAKEREKLAKKLNKKSESKYSKLADFINFKIDILPSEWSAFRYGEKPEAKVIDCLALNSRPWYSCFAPLGKEWSVKLFAAIENGYLDIQDIQDDISAGLVRPSLLKQIKLGIENPFALPETVIALDRDFIPPELAVSQAQIERLNSTTFNLPKKNLFRVYFSRYFFDEELPRLRKKGVPKITKKVTKNLARIKGKIKSVVKR